MSRTGEPRAMRERFAGNRVGHDTQWRRGPVRSRAVAGALAAAALAFPGSGTTAPRLSVTLEYAAPPRCPGATDLQAAVSTRLGYDPFVDEATDHVLVRIDERGNALKGRIEWRDASGKWSGDQVFPSVNTECPGLVRTLGFALAIQIQFLARSAPASTKPEGVPPPEPPPAPPQELTVAPPSPPPLPVAPPPPPADTAVAVSPPAPRVAPAVFALGLGPSVGVGLSSTPVVLGRLFGRLAWQHLALELGALASLPTISRRMDGAGFTQQHLLGTAAACALMTRWSGCVLANGGIVRMAGRDIDRPTSAQVVIAEAGLRAGLTQPLGSRAFLSAHADAVVNLTRWTGTLDQVPVWTAPPLAAVLGVDAGVTFP